MIINGDMIVVTVFSVYAFFSLVWLISIKTRNASLADIIWGPGFALAAFSSYLTSTSTGTRSLVILIMVTLWGIRLAGHIAYRNRGQGEDRRYQAMRKSWGQSFPQVSYLTIYTLQPTLLLIISLPVFFLQVSPGREQFLATDLAGLLLWSTGFIFEAVADWQLLRFKSMPENKGRVMDQGLWHYSRHPNYFGESLMWWGIYIIACGVPMGFITIPGPLVITWLLLKVSGVVMLERDITERRPEYAQYTRSTSAFIPLPRKKLHS